MKASIFTILLIVAAHSMFAQFSNHISAGIGINAVNDTKIGVGDKAGYYLGYTVIGENEEKFGMQYDFQFWHQRWIQKGINLNLYSANASFLFRLTPLKHANILFGPRFGYAIRNDIEGERIDLDDAWQVSAVGGMSFNATEKVELVVLFDKAINQQIFDKNVRIGLNIKLQK